MRTLNFETSTTNVLEFARSLVLEGHWRDAITVLSKAITPEPTVSTVLQLLTGEVKFTADGELVPHQDAAYQQAIAKKYPVIFERFNEYYTPVKCVQLNLHAVDLTYYDNDVLDISTFISLSAQGGLLNNQLIVGYNGRAVLCERVADFPLWVKPVKASEALHPVAAAYTLQTYSDEDFLTLLSNVEILPTQEEKETLNAAIQSVVTYLEEQNGMRSPVYLRKALDGVYYGHKVREQAKKTGGFLTISHGEDSFEVPAAPFLIWAIRRTMGGSKIPGVWVHDDHLPKWKPVSKSGLKMLGDDVIHTDWVVGAGFEPSVAYLHSHPLNKAAWAYTHSLALQVSHDFVTLAGTGKVHGIVKHLTAEEASHCTNVTEGDILVVDHAGPEYELALRKACKGGAGAMICAVGGKLAHLAIVARELDVRLLVMPDAFEKLSNKGYVQIDMDMKKIHTS